MPSSTPWLHIFVMMLFVLATTGCATINAHALRIALAEYRSVRSAGNGKLGELKYLLLSVRGKTGLFVCQLVFLTESMWRLYVCETGKPTVHVAALRFGVAECAVSLMLAYIAWLSIIAFRDVNQDDEPR